MSALIITSGIDNINSNEEINDNLASKDLCNNACPCHMSRGNTSDILWAVLLIGTFVTAFNGDCDLLDSRTTWEIKRMSRRFDHWSYAGGESPNSPN